MKKFERRKVEIERDELVEVNCDLCHNITKTGDWAQGAYDVADVAVELEEGKHYPDCRSTEVTTFDICPKCFKEKLIPWLKSQGAEPTVEDRNT